ENEEPELHVRASSDSGMWPRGCQSVRHPGSARPQSSRAPVRRSSHATLLTPPRPRNGSTAERRARSRPTRGRARAGRGLRREDGSTAGDRRGWGTGPRAFALLLVAYAITHAALRVWISPILNIDDAREAIFTQTLAWGYQPRQPPLYTWLAWVAVRLAGLSV